MEAIWEDGLLLGRRLLVWCKGGRGLCIVIVMVTIMMTMVVIMKTMMRVVLISDKVLSEF